MVNPAENGTTVTRHDETDRVTVVSSIEDVCAADPENRIDLSSKSGLDNGVDQISNFNNDASDIVADEVIQAADDPKPIKKETIVERIAIAQRVDGQCISVVNEQSHGNATVDESKTTSVLHNIED
jgi:hypothetical protein